MKEAVREGGSEYGNDMLGLMLAAVDQEKDPERKEVQFGIEALTEEFKRFFLAGREATASLLTWALMFLGTQTEWQDRARHEVMELCKDGCPPTIETISKMKVMSMIMNESLRLFTPVVEQVREAIQDMKIGHLEVPKGLCFDILRVVFHQDPEIWGNDALEFKPERFVNGAGNASKHRLAFMPFSFGPRYCTGQWFSLQMAKMVMAMVLQKFQFCLSPNYRHAPEVQITLAPKHGMLLVVERVR